MFLASMVPEKVWLCLFLAVAGCGRQTLKHHQFHDVGRICLFSALEAQGVPDFPLPGSRAYGADEPVNVAVRFPACVTSACSRAVQTSCTLEGGPIFRVTSSGSFDEDIDEPCSADCRYLIARCTTGSLPAGAYTFNHGADSISLVVPSTSASPACAGSAGSN
jgi:hypothetical protein